MFAIGSIAIFAAIGVSVAEEAAERGVRSQRDARIADAIRVGSEVLGAFRIFFDRSECHDSRFGTASVWY